MATTNVFVGSSNTFTASDAGLAIYGTLDGIETVKLLPDASTASLDNKIDIVDLSLFNDLRFKQGGNTLQIYAEDGTTQLAIFPVQQDADGTLIQIAGINAPLSAKLTGSVMTLGEWTVPSDTPVQYGFTGSTIEITGSTTEPYDALDNDLVFQINLGGSYDASITGFGSGDTLDFPDGNDASVSNFDWTDNAVDLSFALSGSVVTIHLLGLEAEFDAQLNSVADFNTVFGIGTIV